MPALEPTPGWRVVASPEALDGARWQGHGVEVLRVAPDEAVGLGATGVEVDDPEAIVEPEVGLSSGRLTSTDVARVAGHVEWELPEAGHGHHLVQGKIAGVPARLVLGDPAIIVVQTCYVHDLRTRLGW